MPAPDYYVTQEELERAISARKLRELMPGSTSTTTDTDRVALVLNTATGEVRSYLQVALNLASIDEQWDTWTEKDKSDIRRMALLMAIYYVHYFGERAEDVPETVMRSRDTVLEQLKATAERLKSVGSHEQAATNRHFQIVAPRQVGESTPGGPRESFNRGGGFC